MSVHVRLRVAREVYAMPVTDVLEVVELGEIAPVPGAQGAVLGVRNLRGEVLPVFDLATIFGLERKDSPTRVLVAEHAGKRAGFAIDAVTDVGDLPGPSEETQSLFLRGATLDDGVLVGVVDVARVFEALERGEA